MTPSPTGRADAYPHAADLALIPFATGSATGSRTASMTHVFDGADDPQVEEWRRSIAQAAAEGGTRAQEP